MIYINEWFPNPTGSDAHDEFVELFNSGNAPVSLRGWSLWTGGRSKKIPLDGRMISARGYSIFKRPGIKISLKNTDGGLWLYGPNGAIVDKAAFKGAAPEGKSFSRVDYGSADIEHFAFASPTPGAANEAINNQVSRLEYPRRAALDPPIRTSEFIGLDLGATIVMLAVWIYILYKNENISKFFFPGDTGNR